MNVKWSDWNVHVGGCYDSIKDKAMTNPFSQNKSKTAYIYIWFRNFVEILVSQNQRVNQVWEIQRHRQHCTQCTKRGNKTKNTTRKTKKKQGWRKLFGKGMQFLFLIRHLPVIDLLGKEDIIYLH